VNAAPQVDALTGPTDPVPVGTGVTVRASFRDPGTADTHTATLEWGDGSTSSAAITEASGAGETSASHTYAAAGIYRLVATVTDDDGGSGTSVLDSLVVVDPGASATGSGWIESRQGSYAASRTWSGRGAFWFDAAYVKGARTPSGRTLFALRDVPVSFQSSSYDWLVVTGARAYLRGSGRLNGVDGYAFLLSVVDGDRAGGADRLRMKIWVRATGDVVYDDQPGAADRSQATAAIGGGSIATRGRARD
jgi:hypothetical protein